MRLVLFYLGITFVFAFVLSTSFAQESIIIKDTRISFPPDSDGDGIDDDVDEDDDNDGILDVDETVSCENFGEIFFNPNPSNGDQEAAFNFGDGNTGYFSYELDDPNYAINGYPEYLWGDNYIRAIRGNGLDGITKVIFPNGARGFKMAVANLHSNSTDPEGTNGSLFETQSISFYHNGSVMEIPPTSIINGGFYNAGTLYPGTANAIDQATFVFEVYQEVDSIINTSLGSLDHTSIRINGYCQSDSDNDGIINSLDIDSDNDGLSDEEEGQGDCDNDGLPDFADPDICVEFENAVIPQGFSPNNDGINDTFVILGYENFPNNRLIIFNRWGNKVFEASPYLNNWDGTNHFSGFNNDLLPDGTYYYILSANSNNVPDIKGWIYLKRQIAIINE